MNWATRIPARGTPHGPPASIKRALARHFARPVQRDDQLYLTDKDAWFRAQMKRWSGDASAQEAP